MTYANGETYDGLWRNGQKVVQGEIKKCTEKVQAENLDQRIERLINAHMELSSTERIKKCAALQVIFSYLNDLEKVCAQGLNRSFYSNFIPRIMTKTTI